MKFERAIDDTIEALTVILLKEHQKKSKEKYIITKEDLTRICIKVIKEVQRVYEH